MEQAQVEAEEIFKKFKEHSVAEFFKKNRQMLGLSGKIRSFTTIIHEYVTNSLDACEEANILPTLTVKIDEIGQEYYLVTIRDNGPGMPKKIASKAVGQLLAGTKFHRLKQSRGQQGIGAAGCTMFAELTSGKPVTIKSGSKKMKTFEMELTVDVKKNAPKIHKYTETGEEFEGTEIKAYFKEISYRRGDLGPLEYLRRTAIANPHCELTFIEPTGEIIYFPRSLNQIPKIAKEIKPHPKGVKVDELLTLSKYTQSRKTSSFLKTEFSRIGNTTLKELSQKVSFDLNKDPRKISWQEGEEVINAFKTMKFVAPQLDVMQPIGENRIKASLKNIVKPEFVSVVTRKPSVYSGGYPFQVEAAVAYGGKAGKHEKEKKSIEVLRFANKVPLLFDTGSCALTKGVAGTDWKRYGVQDINSAPISVFVNIISVHLPYTSAGKQAIADEEEVMAEIKLAVQQAGRRISQFISGKRKIADKEMRRKIFTKYASEIIPYLAHLSNKEAKKLDKQLQEIVEKRLKIEEAMEKQEKKFGMEDVADEDISEAIKGDYKEDLDENDEFEEGEE